MKKYLSIILLTAAIFASCTREEPVTPETQVYTLTVTASKSADDPASKALSLDGKTLKVKWDEGEEVEVVQDQDGHKVLGKLYAKASETGSTTLSGTLNIVPTHSSNLLFYLHGSTQDYTGQTGVLLSDENSIEKKYDYASASARWDRTDEFIIDEENKTVSVPGGLDFESSQAIVKFTLVDKLTGNPVNATSLTISGFRNPGSMDIENIVLHGEPGANNTCGALVITPASATSEIYVAIRREYEMLFPFSSFTLTAETAEGVTYNYVTSGDILKSGKYYDITVKMLDTTLDKTRIVNLAEVTGNFTATDGQILMGKLSGDYKVSVAPGATITLSNTTIEGIIPDGEWDSAGDHESPGGYEYKWAGITCEGDATIELMGTNNVKGCKYFSGIYVPYNNTLVICGEGTLNVTGGRKAAGIGGCYASEYQSAGPPAACGNIRIEGGTVNASGGQGGGAGIGTGDIYKSSARNTCGTIEITGGVVTATGSSWGPGIGAGDCGNCGKITISGGTVTANGGYQAPGIGKSGTGNCNGIYITASVTKVTASQNHAGTYNGWCGWSIGIPESSGGQTSCGEIWVGGEQLCNGYQDGFKDNAAKEWLQSNPFVYEP